jgi:RNA polymerase sigma factor (sigma-70 family)
MRPALLLQYLGAQRAFLSDRALLLRFVDGADDGAFAALVRRHSPMVLRLCRRMLHNAHDAEDAFQATFLVLARQAAARPWQESVATWLYEVARRLCLETRAAAARRRTHESRVPCRGAADPLVEISAREAQELLDEELSRLPEAFRAPLVLCCLEAMTRDEAARQLCWSPATLKRRLQKGRELLRRRLIRRGLGVPAALSAALLAEGSAQSAAACALVDSTTRAALLFARDAAGAPSGQAADLAAKLVQTMSVAKAKAQWSPVLALCLLAGALGAGVHYGLAARLGAQTGATSDAAKPPAGGEQQSRTDFYGDPLPEGAVARLGSLRFYHGGRVENLLLSPDGKLVVSSGEGGYRLWDAATGRELPLAEELRSASFIAAGGRLLALKRTDDQIHIWDVADNKQRARLALGRPFGAFALSPDGKTLVVACMDEDHQSSLRFCDVATGRIGEPIRLKKGEVVARFLFSGDGKTLLSYQHNETLHVWDVAARAELRAAPVRQADFATGQVALSPDGSMLAGAPPGKPIRLWDLRTLRDLPPLQGQPNEPAHCPAFSPDGKLLAAVYPRSLVRLWDVSTRREVRQIQAQGFQVFRTTFSADGKTLAIADGVSVTLWDVATGKCRHDFGHTYNVDALHFSPDGKTLVSGAAYHDTLVRVWDPFTGRQKSPLVGHTAGIEAIDYAPDGKLVASGSQDGTARLWDARTGKEFRRLQPEPRDHMIYAMAFSPDGKMLAAGGQRNAVYLWDVATGRELRSFPNPGAWVLRLAFAPDGKLLATWGIGEAAIRLWDVTEGKVVRTLRTVKAGVPSVRFSPDGMLLAASASDGAVRLWDVATGTEVRVLGMPEKPDHLEHGRSFDVAFSPDGKSLAVGYEDGLVLLWEVASGRERHRWAGHRSGAGSVAFSPGGSLLASGSGDRTMLVWDVTGRWTGTGREAVGASDLDGLLADLAGADASKAYRAVRRLFGAKGQAVAALGNWLQPAVPPDARRIARLVSELDHDRFEVREKAAEALRGLGDVAEPELRRVLAGKPSAEVRRRAAALLEQLQPAGSTEQLGRLRAIEVLEHIGTPETRRLLERLARGAPEARLTREARASLERLAKHSSDLP